MHATLVFERKNMFQAGIAARVVKNSSTLKAESDPRKTERRSVFLVSAFFTILILLLLILLLRLLGVQGGVILSCHIIYFLLSCLYIKWFGYETDARQGSYQMNELNFPYYPLTCP